MRVVIALGSFGLLLTAIAGRDDGGTLRPMLASESMTDSEARTVAETTVRAWVRESDERRVVNLVALACPRPWDLTLTGAVVAAADPEKDRVGHIVTDAKFERDGPVWRLDVFWLQGGSVFVMKIVNGELRVCQFDKQPVA